MTIYKKIQFKLFPCLLLIFFALGTNALQAQSEEVAFYYNKIPFEYSRAAVAKFKSFDSLYLGSFDSFGNSKTQTSKMKTITLKEGTILDKDLFDWHQEVKRGIKKPRTIKLIQFDRSGKPIKIWTLEGVLPIEASGLKMTSRGTGSATYLRYKLDRCFIKSWSTSGDAD